MARIITKKNITAFDDFEIESFEPSLNSNVEITSTSSFVDGVVSETITKTIKSGKIIASNRIGKNNNRRTETANTIDISKELVGNIKIGKITALEKKKTRESSLFEFLSGMQGHNVNSLDKIYRKNIPTLSINRVYGGNIFLFGDINNEFNENIYGQQGDIVTVSEKTKKLLPYNDRLSQAYSPTAYVKSGQYILGYPIVTDNIVNFENFANPDAIQGGNGGPTKNGIIEILDVRSSLINTSIADIRIKGIKASFGVSNQDAGQLVGLKGSSIVDDKIEINQGKYDFFEDAQDTVYEAVNLPNAARTMSLEGFVSDGTYELPPFEDKILNESKYSSYSIGNLTSLLLSSSNSNTSEVGSRFIKRQNGFIMEPFLAKSTTTVLGVDSIAFRGLLKG
jgi:hypothetical protein